MDEDGRTQAARLRRTRRQEDIVAATRRLFDATGHAEAHVEEIAREVGINKAIVYRVFTNKEELVALTLASYLDELARELRAAGPDAAAPDRLDAIVDAFVEYAAAHPAFVECANTLMARPGEELWSALSSEALLALGASISTCLGHLTETLRHGNETGHFLLPDPELAANVLYASGLGALQLARVGFLATTGAGGEPEWREVSRARIGDYLRASARALAGAGPGTSTTRKA